MTEPDALTDKAKLPLRMKIAALVIFLIGLVALILLPVTSVWDGHRDLEVQFLVTDAITGQPIPNATVHIVHEKEHLKDPQRSFTLTTDRNGFAKRMLLDCRCSGRHSWLEDTFVVSLPYWSFHASARGFAVSPDELLRTPDFARAAQRGQPFATLVVPIRIKKTE